MSEYAPSDKARDGYVMIEPALSYTPCPELWCVTAYFNPAHFKTRQANYERFAAPIRAAGIPLLTVEHAVGDTPFELPPGPDVLQVRGPHVLWQKERLINLGVKHLPPEVAKVAWLDGDILFTNPDWAVETSRLLDCYPAVQPFARAIRMRRDYLAADGSEYAVDSFAATVTRTPATLQAGTFHAHGHTGFAWAGRREWLVHYGLYEAFLSGNGDHYIAHVLAGDLDSPCMQNVRRISKISALPHRALCGVWKERLHAAIPAAWRQRLHNLRPFRRDIPAFWQHFERWARPVAAATGQIGWTPGEVLHLWHGEDVADRGHGEGWLTMHRNGFDPAVDLRTGPSGSLEWASDKPALHTWAQAFFQQRREDGE